MEKKSSACEKHLKFAIAIGGTSTHNTCEMKYLYKR